VHDLPEDLRTQLRPAKTVSARVNSLRRLDTTGVTDPTVALRLRLIGHRVAMVRDVLEQDKAATAVLDELTGRIPDFRRAYEPDGLRPDEFDAYGATVRTLRAFIGSYHDMLAAVREIMLPDPDLRTP
jgi:hypothetical protein